MAGDGQPRLWGLWNEQLTEWFNPGNRQPFTRTPEEAKRLLPRARREYPVGKWEVRQFIPEDQQGDDGEGGRPAQPGPPAAVREG